MESVRAGTVFQPWHWPNDTWMRRRMEILKLGIDPRVGEGEVKVDLLDGRIITLTIPNAEPTNADANRR